jgi:hypothetical protein
MSCARRSRDGNAGSAELLPGDAEDQPREGRTRRRLLLLARGIFSSLGTYEFIVAPDVVWTHSVSNAENDIG